MDKSKGTPRRIRPEIETYSLLYNRGSISGRLPTRYKIPIFIYSSSFLYNFFYL